MVVDELRLERRGDELDVVGVAHVVVVLQVAPLGVGVLRQLGLGLAQHAEDLRGVHFWSIRERREERGKGE